MDYPTVFATVATIIRKHVYMKFIAIIVFLFSCSVAWGQDTTSAQTLPGGKWEVCTDLYFSKDYQCDSGFTSYEFFGDGTFKEDRQPIYGGGQLPFVSGKWKLNGNKLTIDADDGKDYTEYAHTYKIVWLDNNRFYAVGREGLGGPKVYTYFKRVK